MVTNNSCNYDPTQYNVQTGGASGTLNNVAPSATSGVPLISQGASAQPIFGTVAIAGGGTNATSMSTSTGIIKYDGTSLVTSSTAKIDSSNRFTNTSQPAFMGYVNSVISNVTGDGTLYTIVYDAKVFDQATNFSTVTGLFTAPITGKYQFNAVIQISGLAAVTSVTGNFIVNGTTYYRISSNSSTLSSPSVVSSSGAALISLSANDTVGVTIQVSGGSKVGDVDPLTGGVYQNHFSGHLSC